MLLIAKASGTSPEKADLIAQTAAKEVALKTDEFARESNPAQDLRTLTLGGAPVLASDPEDGDYVEGCEEGENFNIFECIYNSLVLIFGDDNGEYQTSTREPCQFGNFMCIN